MQLMMKKIREIANYTPSHQIRYSPFHYRCLTVVKIVFHFFSIWIVTLLTQLALFNLIFLTLAFAAAPVETGSLSLLCAASLFCLITFLAVILKIFFKFLEKPLKDDPKNRMHRQCCIKICPYLYGFFLFGIVFISLAAGVIAFVVFISLYTIKVQEYRNSCGVLVSLGALLPSVLAVGTGIFLQKLFRCLVNEMEAILMILVFMTDLEVLNTHNLLHNNLVAMHVSIDHAQSVSILF